MAKRSELDAKQTPHFVIPVRHGGCSPYRRLSPWHHITSYSLHKLTSNLGLLGRAWCFKYSAFTEKLPTRAFLVALEEDEEIEAQLSRGVNVRTPDLSVINFN